MSESTRTALVLGATGGIGGETSLALARHGWKIRAFARGTSPSSGAHQWDWIKGDAMDRASVVEASNGVHAIVHAVSPPGYRNWAKLVLPMIDNTIAAAKASGARILVTGKPSLQVKKLPWFFFKLAGPFNETLRETAANRPLWTTPIELDNAQLVRFLGKEPQTDLDRAVETTLRGLGCLAK